MRWLILLFLFSSLGIFAQEKEVKDSLLVQSIMLQKEKDTTHSPRKAAILSIVPGGGQIYNHLAMPKGKKKAFWKVPLIYAGLGATGYYAIKNHQTQKILKEEYLFRAKNGIPNLSEYSNYDNQGVLSLFESHRTNRDLLIFAFIGVFGLNILDAHVEAHFVRFDVTKDLTLHIQPTLLDFNTPGIGVSLSFKK